MACDETNKAKLHVGDVGTTIRCQFVDQAEQPLDISQALVKEISIEQPAVGEASPVAVLHAGTFAGDGSDGLLNYVLQSGDLPVPGYYHFQGHVTFTGGADHHSNRVRVRVMPNNAAPSP